MNVCCVVVSYYSDVDRLIRLVESLLASSENVIVVDNSEVDTLDGRLPEGKCRLISLRENTGVAHAQNVGIAAAIDIGADAIVFFDDDSEVAPEMIEELTGVLTPGRPSVAASVCVERSNNGELPSFRLSRWGIARKVYAAGAKGPYEVDLVIASGSAATAATFERVGFMDEDLFIDFVDFEWCLRCRNAGVSINVVPTARLLHSIGTGNARIGPIGGPLHGPARSYYKLRNALLLFRKRHIPRIYAALAAGHALAAALVVLAVVKNRTEYARMFALAIRHGICGVTGKNPAQPNDAFSG